MSLASRKPVRIRQSGRTGNRGMTIMASKPVATPIKQNHRLSEALGEKKVDKKMYQRLVGRLIYLAHTRSHTSNSWLACVAPRNPLGQPSQCPTCHKTQEHTGLSPTRILFAPTWSRCLMLSMDPTLNDLPSGHAGPLYRLHRGNPTTNLTKSPTLTLSLQLQASTNPS